MAILILCVTIDSIRTANTITTKTIYLQQENLESESQPCLSFTSDSQACWWAKVYRDPWISRHGSDVQAIINQGSLISNQEECLQMNIVSPSQSLWMHVVATKLWLLIFKHIWYLWLPGQGVLVLGTRDSELSTKLHNYLHSQLGGILHPHKMAPHLPDTVVLA